MSAYISPAPKLQFFDANGVPLSGGKLYSYAAGTTTPLATYTDYSGLTNNTNPIILDSRGEANVWLGASSYKFRLATSADVEIWTVDNITAAQASLLSTLAASGGSALVGYLPAGTGAVASTVQSKLRQTVSVYDFMTSAQIADVQAGTASLDVTAALQSALDYCATNGYQIQGEPGTYKITSTLSIKCSGDMSAMTIKVNAASVATSIRVGPNTAGQYLFDADLALPFIINTAKTGAGWTGFASSIGIEIANVYQSRIVVRGIYNFGVGLKTGGYSVGCVYNTFTIGVLFGNKINLQCKPGDASGWSNQNTYIGGRYGYSSAEGTNVTGVIHIQLRDFDAVGGDFSPNNNTWVNPSVEGDEPQFHLDIQGAFNTFITPRLEMTTATPARVNFQADLVGQTVSNNIVGGFDISGTTYTYSGAGTSQLNKKLLGSGSDALEYSGNGINILNKSGNSVSAPHIQGFLSTQKALQKTEASTDWVYRLHGNGIDVKSDTDTNSRITFDPAGYLYLGRGGVAPVNYLRAAAASTGIIVGGDGTNGGLYPDADNKYPLGSGSFRWSVVYAGTGTINTSDQREKQDVADLSEAEKRVAGALKGLVKKFRFKDAVASKGDDARIHIGVIAQEVVEAFKAEGLDPMRYGMVCYDNDRYGIRYDELLAFIIAAL